MKIYKENSDDLGFVHACLFSQAISLSELKLWAESIVINSKECPNYIFDLIDFNEAIYKLTNVIGFVPSWHHDKDDEIALIGIAFKRGVEVYDASVSRNDALKVLERKIELLERFIETFPFIDIK